MRKYTVNAYVSGLPWIKMWTTLPDAPTPAPVPPAPPVILPISISGTITANSVGFSAPLEISTNGTIFSAASGSYGFNVSSGYSGSTAAHWSGGTFVPLAYHYTNVTSSYINQNFAFYGTGTIPTPPPAPVYLISGTITEDGTGFSAGLEFSALGTFFSATSGSYGLNVVPGYSGTALPHYSGGGTFVPQLRVYTTVGTDYPAQDYAYGTATPPPPPSLYLISGTTTDARFGGTGFSVPLEISGLGTVSSAASGSYGVSVVSGYSGSIIPHLSGGSFVPESRTYASVGSNYTSQDYIFYGTVPPVPPVASYLISGTITTSGSIGVSCAISLNTRTITSAANGSYGYAVASGYSGTTQPAYITSPGSYAYVNVTSDQPNQDFDAPAPLLSYNSLDWTWSLTNPQYWEIQIKDPDYGMHDLVAGSDRTHSITEYDFWWRIVGRDASLNINTPFSNEVYSTPPPSPYTPSTVLVMPLNAVSGLSLLPIGFAGSNLFASIDGLGGAYTSTDALNWTATGVTTAGPECIAYGSGLYAVGILAGSIETSPDTLNWTPQASPTGETFFTMIYADNRFVGGGFNGMMVTSVDGTNWSLTSTGGAENVRALAHGNGTYVAAAETAIYTSADGTVWAAAPAPSSAIIAVTYSPDFARFYAGGNGILLESADTVTWADITGSLTVDIVGLAAGNGTVVAAAYQGTVYSTADGTNWSKEAVADPTMGATGYLDSAVFCAPSVFFVGETTPPT
jgi:hypothetical protein